MPRKTPRDPEQARKLARYFRERYLSPEAIATAEREMQRLREEQARSMPEPEQPFADLLARAGDVVPQEDGEFSASERARARDVLDAIKARYRPSVVH